MQGPDTNQPRETSLVMKGSRPRRLPWSTERGGTNLLVTDSADSFMSRMADNMEAAQLQVARATLKESLAALTNPLSTRAAVEYAGIRLSEVLEDVLRVADVRGERLGLPATADDAEEELA